MCYFLFPDALRMNPIPPHPNERRAGAHQGLLVGHPEGAEEPDSDRRRQGPLSAPLPGGVPGVQGAGAGALGGHPGGKPECSTATAQAREVKAPT